MMRNLQIKSCHTIFIIIILIIPTIKSNHYDNNIDVYSNGRIAAAAITNNHNNNNNNNNIDKFQCTLPDNLIKEIGAYQGTVNKIVNEIVNGKYAGDTWNSLAEFTDTFGARLSGSTALEQSIDYMVDKMKEVGLENVHTENASVPHWERGYESAQLIQPHKQNLQLLGLGGTVGTPRGGIIGDVIVVENTTEFAGYTPEQVRGKIVVFVPKWEGYGKTVYYRAEAANLAGAKGAIATLIRSITPFSIGSPHTGTLHYNTDVHKIPAACITVEDAEMLLRLYRRGESIQIHLEMEDRNFPAAISRNTIGELLGHVKLNESVVVVSGHLDSWDVGVGAMDDGGGAFISWKAVQYLKEMKLRPKRTIRAILWTGEEQGYVGARAYMQEHAAQEKEEFNFFIESDMGTFDPLGLDFSGNADGECIFKEILKLMSPLNATKFDKPIDAGPDISLWAERGFPAASLINQNEKYFWYHHSAGDSMLVENSNSLDKNTALFAAAAYIIADLSIDIPRDLQ